MPLVSSMMLEASNLAVTCLLLLEVASIKDALREAEPVDVRTPAPLRMVKGWVA